MRSVLCLLLFVLVSCEDPRVPLSEARVNSIADMKLELLEKKWGSARETVAPDGINDKGQHHWVVHYPRGPKGEIRLVYVNDDSNWATIREAMPEEFAKEGEAIPTELVSARPAEVMEQLRFAAGSSILIMAAKPDKTELEAEAKRLNELGKNSGLVPQFSVRTLPTRGFQLIYGWNGEHGIKPQQGITDWLGTHAPEYSDAYWLDLLGND